MVVFVGAGVACALLWAVDAVRLLSRTAEPVGELLPALGLSLVWHLAGGFLAGVVGGGGAAVYRAVTSAPSGSWRRTLLVGCAFGALGLPLFLRVSETVLGGARVADHWSVPALRVVAPTLMILVTGLGVMGLGACSRGPARALLGAACCVAIAGASGWWDSSRLRGQYEAVHEAATILTLVAAVAACSLLLRACGARPKRATWAVALTGLLALGSAVVFQPGLRERSVLRRASQHGAAVLRLRDALSPDRAAPRPALPDDAVRRHRRVRTEQNRRSRRALDRAIPDRQDWNLLWITVDTVRADRLSCYGYERETSPEVDRFARGAVLFEQAWCQNPFTHYSFQSMFYGLYPRTTPLFLRRTGVADPEQGAVTLARRLRDRGFVTAAVPAVPAGALDREEYRVLTRDFEEINPGRSGTSVDADAQTSLGVRFLRRRGAERWFLWLHYMDPHAPYTLHREWGFGASASDRYDGEVRTVDRGIGEVLRALRERGLADRTVVVINGDHGEALGDHDTDHHGSTLYQEQVHVPLIVRVPGVPPGRVRRPVENVDIATTALDLLAVDGGPETQGDSLAGLLLQGDAFEGGPPPVAFADIPPGTVGPLSPSSTNQVALRRGPWKLVSRLPGGDPELYDLRSDPGERRDVAHREPTVVVELEGVLRTVMGETVARRGDARGLRQRLQESSGDRARLVLLREAIRRREPGIEDVVRWFMTSDECEHGLRTALLPFAAPLLGEAAGPMIESALRRRASWGAVRAALDGLAALQPSVRRRHASDLVPMLRDLLSAPFVVARPAAESLALAGDRSGLELLRRGLAGPDHRVRFTSAVAAMRLGEEGALSAVLRGLGMWRYEVSLVVDALDALAATRTAAALPAVVELVKSPFVDHAVAAAAIRYLSALEDEAALCGFVFLLQGWDPATGASVREHLDGWVGEPRRRALQAVARELPGAFDLARRGDEAAVQVFVDASNAAGPAGGALFRVYGARVAAAAGSRSRAESLRDSVLEEPRARLWHGAARMSAAGSGVGARGLVVERAWCISDRPRDGAPFVHVAVRLRNSGSAPVSGGDWSGGPRLSVRWDQGDGAGDAVPRALPEAGLEPGGSVVVVIPCPSPPAGEDVRGVVISQAGAVPMAAGATSARSWTWSFDAYGHPPSGRFEGRQLMRSWWPDVSTVAVEERADGGVTYVASLPGSYLLSPGLRAHGGPLKVALDFRVSGVAGGEHSLLACQRAYGEDMAGAVPPDRFKVRQGVRQQIDAELPAMEGQGLRRLRLGPAGSSAILTVWSVELSPP